MTYTPTRFAPHLVRWYGTLAILACLGALQALALPRWPKVEQLNTTPIKQALERGGFKAVPLVLLPPGRSYDLASSSAPGFGLAAGRELRLVKANVRERKNLKIAYIGRDLSAFTLKDRQVLKGPPPTASGLVDSQPALQTCLVQGVPGPAGFGVDWKELAPKVDKLTVGPQASPLRPLRVALGLQANRSYECVLISLRSTDGSTIPLPLWRRLLHTLQPALQPGAQRASKA